MSAAQEWVRNTETLNINLLKSPGFYSLKESPVSLRQNKCWWGSFFSNQSVKDYLEKPHGVMVLKLCFFLLFVPDRLFGGDIMQLNA